MARKKQFKTESKRLMDLMINSIYTNREIFIRELISNASDAIDKLYYRSLSDNLDGMTGISRDAFFINVSVDKDSRTITVEDNGCGMTEEEMESNLGIIAKSGSGAFKESISETSSENNKANEASEASGTSEAGQGSDIDIIGQFGVGFYSAFMVSEKVTVTSKAHGSDDAFVWESFGADGYTIESAEKDSHGTKIVMVIKENTDDENYDEFIESYRLRSIIKKYSDYIRYPIKMETEKSRLKEGTEDEYETYTEVETVNSMVPIWKRNKNELTEEDYNNFYRDKFFDYSPPAKVIHVSTEGVATYNALMFIPSQQPLNFYSREYEKGLQLYASGVLIMDKCSDLVPDYFSFVRGLVDSQDLSLNISREMLQQDRQLETIATRIDKKIQSELANMLKNEREKYDEFFSSFGTQLKYGVYSDYGQHKDKLSGLIMFYSSTEKKLVTLAEYISRMKEDQKYIYYATGKDVDKIDRLPQTEMVKDKDFEILYLTDEVDEFALKILNTFEEKEFRSVSSGDLGFENEDDAVEESEAVKNLFEFMTESLDNLVKAVRLSKRLKSHPVCLSSEGELSLEMEKVLNAMPNDQKVKAEKILEINENHPIFEKLQTLYETDKDKLTEFSSILYNQALLIEGLPIEDPVEFSNAVSKLMTEL